MGKNKKKTQHASGKMKGVLAPVVKESVGPAPGEEVRGEVVERDGGVDEASESGGKVLLATEGGEGTQPTLEAPVTKPTEQPAASANETDILQSRTQETAPDDLVVSVGDSGTSEKEVDVEQEEQASKIEDAVVPDKTRNDADVTSLPTLNDDADNTQGNLASFEEEAPAVVEDSVRQTDVLEQPDQGEDIPVHEDEPTKADEEGRAPLQADQTETQPDRFVSSPSADTHTDPEIINQNPPVPPNQEPAAPSLTGGVHPEQDPPIEETADLFGDVPELDGRVHEFDAAVGSHVHVEPGSGTTHRAEKDTDAADLFGASGGAEEDLFGGPEHAGAEDLFGSGQEARGEGLVESVHGSAAKEDGLFVTTEGPQESDDLFGAVATTELDFITSSPAVPQSEGVYKVENEDLSDPVYEGTRKEDGLFATTGGDPQESDDLFGAVATTELDFITPSPAVPQSEGVYKVENDNLSDTLHEGAAKEDGLFAVPEGNSEADDLFGATTATDLDFIASPQPPQQPQQPTKQRVEEMDLDAAGVPQGWVDESGGWNWYTAEERLDVARGMFDGQEDEKEQEVAPPVVQEVSHDPYTAQTSASNLYQPSYAPPSVHPYAPSPATGAVQATTGSAYDPYKPTASTSPVNAYAPVGSNTYSSYQAKPSAVHSHVQVEPPTRSFSPYDPPVSSVSRANVYTPAAPVITASSPYTASPPVHPASSKPAPAPALTRMKTSTAYDPPMIPVTKALSRPASAAQVLTPFAAPTLPPSGLGITGLGSSFHVPPGVTPPPPVGPPRSLSRVVSPPNALPHSTMPPPARKPQQVASALAHPIVPNAYDPPALPVMHNRPASRVATPATTGFGSPQSPVGAVLHQSSVLPPPPKSTPGLTAPPRAPPSVRQPPPQVQPPRRSVDTTLELPRIQAEPPTPDHESPRATGLVSPPSQYAPPPHATYPAPPRMSQPPVSQRVSQPHAPPPVAAPPLTYGVPAPNYQAPPFSRPSSGMKGVFDRPLSRDAVPDHYPNENHARMNVDDVDVAPAEETTEMGSIPTEEQGTHQDEVTAAGRDEPEIEDPEGGAFAYEEDEGEFAEYSVQSVKPRPQLQQNTFAPPSPPVVKASAPSVQQASPYDPYAPKHQAPVSAPAYTPVTANVPIRPATAPYPDLASDPYAPHASLPSQSYMPTSSYQHPTSLAVPLTPGGQASPVPVEPFGHLPGIPPQPSAYEPVDASARHNLDEDPLARASPAARKVPSVSFGPNGSLVVAFQRNLDEDTSLHSTSLAYGDDSKGLPVHIRRLADALPPAVEESGSTPWPGPLLMDPQASKTSAAEKKKRDSLNAFLTERIQEIESGLPYLSASGKDVVTRANQEATMLLYQVAQLMLKHDGKVLTSDPAAQAELRAILPKLSQALTSAQSTTVENANGIGSTADTHYLSEFLLKGDQQAALQYATDHQLWSHALLLASGIDTATWTTTVSAFVKATVQSAGADGSHAVLATAYSIYGQGGPAVVESIPNSDLPSIWRNSLATIVASSKPNDATYIIALAEKLNKQGLVKAAHLCYVLSPMIVAWQQSRPDSPISLIGSSETDQQTESTLISEILEYVIWLRPVPKGTEAFHGVPGLLQYKLNKAATLFATGEVALAKRYCEAIIASLRLHKVPDQASQRIKVQLQNLLSRINGEEFNVANAKGLPKPKLENLGSWFEGTLTKFIAGEESETTGPKSSGHAKKSSSGSAGIGPFSHFSAITPESTPALPSRAMSSYDIPATSSFPPPITRSGSAMSYRPQAAVKPITQQRPTSAMSYRGQEHRLSALSQVSTRATDESTGYGLASEPTNVSEPAQASQESQHDAQNPVEQEHTVEIPTWGQSYTFEDTNQQDATAEVGGADEGSFINPMANFITPAVSAYPSAAPTPPSAYQPQTNRQADFEEDDDDLGLGNASHKQKQAPSSTPTTKAGAPTSNYAPPPAQEGAAVDATVKEPEKPKESPKPASGGSWLGRLWGKGGAESPPTGPVRAKLGNESSMYYDKELKRWVTKGPGGQPEAPKAAPPPPRAAATPKPSTPSAVPSPNPPMPPSSRPTSAAPPAFGGAPAGGPARSLAATPALAGITTPPSRPTSTVGDPPIGNALAAPPGRRAGTVGKKSIRSRYVEIS